MAAKVLPRGAKDVGGAYRYEKNGGLDSVDTMMGKIKARLKEVGFVRRPSQSTDRDGTDTYTMDGWEAIISVSYGMGYKYANGYATLSQTEPQGQTVPTM